jgi:tryptophanyl-tRNA synthetase
MRVLSGMQPSGEAHIGNYFGSMKPNVDLLKEGNVYFIADLHALTSITVPGELRKYRQGLVRDLLACGFDPKKGILFFQSDVPEHPELAWILSCVTPIGLLERAVSFKEKVGKGISASAGLFTYPVLQAADILLYDADVVPVGADQKQHIEMTRDIAIKFNNTFGETFVVPQAQVRRETAIVPGTDGQKMSKSYGNTIPLFADEKTLKKIIMSITTDSKTVEERKDPETCTVYKLHALLLDEGGKRDLAKKYRAGGLGYSEAKEMFFEAFMDYFGEMRERRQAISDKQAEEVMEEGAMKARKIAAKTMERVRKGVGLR